MVARREGEGSEAAVAVVGVMKPLTRMVMMAGDRGGGGGSPVGQRVIHSVLLLLLLKEGENGIIIDWPINQTNRGRRRKWRGRWRAITNALSLGARMWRWKDQSPNPPRSENDNPASSFSMKEFMTKLGTINLKASRCRGLSSEALTA